MRTDCSKGLSLVPKFLLDRFQPVQDEVLSEVQGKVQGHEGTRGMMVLRKWWWCW